MTAPQPRGSRRLIYVSDPSSIATNWLPDPVAEGDLRDWVDLLAECGVDTLDQEVFSQGWTAYFRSDRPEWEYDRRRQHRRFLRLLDAGVNPLEVLIDQSHRRGMQFLAGFRVNDDHAYQARAQGVGVARFIEEHPHLRLTAFPDGEMYRLAEPLDFSFPEVREFTFGVVDEVARRFAIDGVELAFRDHAYFPPGAGGQQAHLMTDLVRRLRARLGGRALGVRVFSTPAECRHLGLDVATWIGEGLIDYVSPQDVMYADFRVPVAEWAALTRPTACRLYPGLLPWTSLRARQRLGQQPLTEANRRALAHAVYAAGGDGLSVYNHFTAMWHAPFYPQQLAGLRHLRDPARVAAGERHYVFDPTWDRFAGFGRPGATSTGAVRAERLILERRAGATGQLQFPLYEALDAGEVATLALRGFGLDEADELQVRLNGHPIADGAIRRTRASGAPPAAWETPIDRGGRGLRALPEQGRTDVRPEQEPPFSTRWFRLEPAVVARGANTLTLTRLADGLVGPIEVDEVEVWVTPA